MIWVLATLSGITKIETLLALVLLNVLLQALGFLIESKKKQGASAKELISLLFVSWGIHLAIWVPIIVSFYNAVHDVEEEVPVIVYGIIWVLFGLFNAFGIWSTLHVFDVISDNTLEWGYIGLSLTAKSLLTWMAFGGVFNAEE
jgi:hypothetical protein